MKKCTLLLIVFLEAVFFSYAQTKKWELVKNAPDRSTISLNTKIIAADNAVYLYQMNTAIPAVAPSVSVSLDGIHFNVLGILPDSLGKVEPLFCWKNEIYIRSTGGSSAYFKSQDGITFQPFLPKDYTGKDIVPLAFGIVRDTLYAYCNIFQPIETQGFKDSLFFMAGTGNKWKSVYGKNGTEFYTVINTQGQLLLNSTAGYLDFPSLTHAPRVITKTSITLYAQRWSAGQYLVSYDANHNFDGNPAVLLTDTKALTSVPMPLPQSYLETDVFNLMVLPDGSIVLNNRKLATVPQISNPISYDFIYRTKDYGASWTIVDSFPDNYANRRYLAVYTYKNIWYTTNTQLPYQKSADQGATWTTASLSGIHWNSAFTAIGGDMALNGQYFSKDNAATWQSYATAFLPYTVSSIYWRNNQLGWFFSDNTTSAFYELPPASNIPVAMNSGNAQYFQEALLVQGQIVYLYRGGYADFNSGLFYKYNQITQTWSQIADLKLLLRANPAMYMFTDGQNLYYYDIENNIINGVFVSSDIGLSWTLLPMPTILVPGGTPVYAFYDDRSNGLYMSIRESNMPTTINVVDTIRFFKMTASGFIPVAANGFVNQPTRQPSAPVAFQNLIRLSTGQYCWSQNSNKTILYLFRSTDNAENWVQINTDALRGTVINIGEGQQGKLYIATSYDLYREADEDTDGGTVTTNNIDAPEQTAYVYPNPANGQVTFVSKQQQNAELTDITGKTILHTQLQSGKNSIDISMLLPGMYIIKTETISTKLIVQ